MNIALKIPSVPTTIGDSVVTRYLQQSKSTLDSIIIDLNKWGKDLADIGNTGIITLASGNILVGNGSNVAAGVAMSGEATLASSGAITLLNSAVIGKVLTGYSAAAGSISAADTILSAFNKAGYSIALSHAAATMSVTGLTLTGQAISLTAGYVIPTTTEESNWNTAFADAHVHANITYLNAIDQYLATSSSPSFANIATTGNITLNPASGTNYINLNGLAGDGYPKLQLTTAGVLNFGAGGASAFDTNLYRVSSGILKTDNTLSATGGIYIGANLLTDDGAGTNLNSRLTATSFRILVGVGKYATIAQGTGGGADFSLTMFNALPASASFLKVSNLGVMSLDTTVYASQNTDVAFTSVTTANVYGSASSGADLHLNSTSHATKGKIYFGSSYYDEANKYLYLTSTASNKIDLEGGTTENSILMGHIGAGTDIVLKNIATAWQIYDSTNSAPRFSISTAGAITISNLGTGLVHSSSVGLLSSSLLVAADVTTNTLTYATLQQVSQPAILGRFSAGAGNISELALDLADTTRYLRKDGTWQVPASSGITALTGDVTASGSGSQVATIVKIAAMTTAGVVHNAATTGILSSSLIVDADLGALSGWLPSTGWSYSSADAPTFVIATATDLTGVISVGMKIKLTQTTVKYFIVTAITSSTITVYGGTDYTLANAAITLPYYSTQKAPFGFPMNQTKWELIVTSTTQYNQANATNNIWYNLGTTNQQINIPIGFWDVSYQVMLAASPAAGSSSWCKVTLSTANNTQSDANMTASFVCGVLGLFSGGTVSRRGWITLTTKQTYYLNTASYNGTNTNNIYNYNADGQGGMVLKATCAYL